MTPPSKVERLAPYVAGIALAAPVLVTRYPPMTDLPHHEALVALLRHFGDPSFAPPGLYLFNPGEPNQLFHLVAWLFSLAVRTDTACKIVVALTLFALPVCAARFAAHVGASRWAALLVAPLALGWFFAWGLIANLIGTAAFLAVLPWLDANAEAPTARRAALATLGCVVLYFAHESMMIIYGGAALLFALAHPIALRKTALRLAPLVAGFAIAVGQNQYQKRFMSPLVAHVPVAWVSLPAKIVRIPDLIFPASERAPELLFFAMLVLAMALMLRLRANERRAAGLAPPATWRDKLHRWRFEAFAACCFVAYLAFPLTLNGATLVYQRFFLPAFTVFAIVAAPRDMSLSAARIARLLAAALPVGTLLMAWPSFADADRAYRDLDLLLRQIEPGSAVAGLSLGRNDATRTFSLAPAHVRALATRGGRALYTFTDSPIAPVVLAPEYRWNESMARVSKTPNRFRPAHDLKMYKYVIVRAGDTNTGFLAVAAMQPEAELVDVAGEFLLLRSKLDVIPLLSPEPPMEDPKPATLRKRMADAFKAIQRNAEGANAPTPPPEEPESEPGDSSEPPITRGHL